MRYKYSDRSGYRQYSNHDQDIRLNKFNVFVCGLVSLTTISAFALLSSTVSADTASVNTISTTVPASCSFTSASTSSYGATILNGQTSTITGDPITASCNDASGYAVYAIGYSGDTYTGDYHTDMISTLNNSYNIKTNGTNGASYWKMKLQNLSNATITNSYGDYQVIPSSFTKVASYTSNTQAASFTPVYQIYIGATQPADTYTGKVKYTLVHPNTMVAGTYTIAYNANGGSGTMNSETGIYNFEGHTLPASTFTAPSGYVFAGWCTVQDQTQNPQTTCTGASYAVGDSLHTSVATDNGTVTLYALWNILPTMQGFAANNQCATMNINDTINLIDSRDGESYSVAKLADGKCWMTENLDLAGGTALSANDTDVTSAYISNFSTSNNLTKSGNTIVLPASALPDYDENYSISDDTQFSVDNYSYVFNSGMKESCDNDRLVPCYSYYSWDAATLGSGRSISTENTDAPYSICPKGWRLPTSGADHDDGWKRGDYYALATAYGADLENDYWDSSYSSFSDTFGPGSISNFLFSASYDYGFYEYEGVFGLYWSSTSGSATEYANAFQIASGVGMDGDWNRRVGQAVRCLIGN